jgi:hypothetical protein
MKKEIYEKFEDTKDRQYNDKIKGQTMIKKCLVNSNHWISIVGLHPLHIVLCVKSVKLINS